MSSYSTSTYTKVITYMFITHTLNDKFEYFFSF